MINEKFITYRVSRYEPIQEVHRIDASPRVSKINKVGISDYKFENLIPDETKPQTTAEEATEMSSLDTTYAREFHDLKDMIGRTNYRISGSYDQNKLDLTDLTPQRILVPIDMDDLSKSLILVAGQLCEFYNSHIEFCHVTQGKYSLSAHELEQKLYSNILSLLEPDAPQVHHLKKLPSVTILPADGETHVATVIRERFDTGDFDLLLVGAHKQTFLSRALHGSVSDDILSMIVGSVLVERSGFDLWNIKRILVPVDGTEFSYHALRQALQLAQNFRAEIFVFHVVGADESESSEWKTPLEKINWHSINHEFAEGSGEITESIATFSNAHNIDLVVMTSHGSHRHEASVALTLIRNTALPVWVLRVEDAAFR